VKFNTDTALIVAGAPVDGANAQAKGQHDTGV